MSIEPAGVTQEALEKKAVREFFDNSSSGVFVEVGANEPQAETSQSWHLEQLGWTGVLVEPLPQLCELARATRPRSKTFNVACTSPDKVGTAELKIPVVDSGQISAHAGLDPELDQAGYSKYDIHRVQAVTLDSVLEQA